jgi:hypothetical protein
MKPLSERVGVWDGVLSEFPGATQLTLNTHFVIIKIILKIIKILFYNIIKTNV